jgi:hypothetical protein
MNSIHRTVRLPTKEIILPVFFEKFPVMQILEALHHLTKARHDTIRLSLTALGVPFCYRFSTHPMPRKRKITGAGIVDGNTKLRREVNR